MRVHLQLLAGPGTQAGDADSVADLGALHPPQARLLLAFLITERQRAVGREEVAALLWAESVPASWEAALRGLVHHARGFLARHGAGSLVVARHCYELRLPPDAVVDVEQGAVDLRTADAAALRGDPRDTLTHANRARQTFVQPFLPHLVGDWAHRARAQHRERLAHALELIAMAHGRLGDHTKAIDAAREAWTLLPLREEALRALINAYRASDDRAGALRTYHRGRERIRRELGVGLSASTERLFLDVLREDAEQGERVAQPSPVAHENTLSELRDRLTAATAPAERAQLLLRLGTLQRLSGSPAEADGAFAEAAAGARMHRDPVLLATVAAAGAAYDRLNPHAAGTGLALVEEALEALPPGEHRSRAVLIARQTQYLASSFRNAEAERAAERLAGLVDDPDPVQRSWALTALLHASTGPEAAARRLAASHALTRAATEVGETELVQFALEQRVFALAEGDDLDRAAVAIGEYAREAGRTGLPWARFVALAHRAWISAANGRFGECDQITLELLRSGQAVAPDTILDGFRTSLLYVPRWMTGRAGDLLPRVRALQEWLDVPETRASVAFLAAESGDDATARAALSGISADPGRTMEQSPSWSFAMFNLVGSTVRLGDRDRCEALYRTLTPHADRNCLYAWLIYLGSFHLHLGRLALACGNLDAAVEHLETALDRHRTGRVKPWIALAGAALAGALQQRAAPGEHDRADRLSAEATELAQRLGMRPPSILLGQRAGTRSSAWQGNGSVRSAPRA